MGVVRAGRRKGPGVGVVRGGQRATRRPVERARRVRGGALAARLVGRGTHRRGDGGEDRSRLHDGEPLERDGELPHALDAARPLLFEASQHDRLEIRRDVGAQRAKRVGLVADDRCERRGRALSFERSAPREEPVQDGAERPHVRARVDVAGVADLLRGHVERGSEHVARRRELVVVRAEHLGDAEVEHLEERGAVGPRREEEVRGLEIAVDDAALVGLEDGLARLEHQVHRLDDGERAALLRVATEVDAVEHLHDDVRIAALHAPHVEHARHVLGGQPRRGARLTDEARRHLDVAVASLDDARVVHVLERGGGHRPIGEQQLDRDAVACLEVDRGHDDAHAAGAELALDPVPARDQIPSPGRGEAGGRGEPSGGKHGCAGAIVLWKSGPAHNLAEGNARLLRTARPEGGSAPGVRGRGCGDAGRGAPRGARGRARPPQKLL